MDIKTELLLILSMDWDHFGDTETIGWFACGQVDGDEISGYVDTADGPVLVSGYLDPGWYIIRINDLGQLIHFYFKDHDHAEDFFHSIEEDVTAAWRP